MRFEPVPDLAVIIYSELPIVLRTPIDQRVLYCRERGKQPAIPVIAAQATA